MLKDNSTKKRGKTLNSKSFLTSFEKWQVLLSEAPNLHEIDRTSSGDYKQRTLASMNALKVNNGKEFISIIGNYMCHHLIRLSFPSTGWTV